jgi:hypothetical protein
MADNTALLDRIEIRLAALGISERKASLSATQKPDLIRDIRRGKEVGTTRLVALAEVLGTTLDYLTGRTDFVSPEGDARAIVPQIEDMPQDIPVFGTAIGAATDYWGDHEGGVAIEQTDLNTGEIIDYYRRPPALRHRRDVYVLYVAGDSMAPAHESGRGILVDPAKTPAVMDYVVVYLRSKTGEDAAGALIKRLVARGTNWIELEQFNPPARFRLEERQYQAIHRVKPWDEVFGV